MPDFSSDTLQSARQAGYTDDQIYDYWSQKDPRFDTARQSGYKLDDVASHLSQTNTPSLPSQEITPDQPRMGLADMLFDKETAQNLRGAIQDVVYSIPGMAAQIPKMAYKGLKFAVGGPQERAQIGEQALTEAVAQGNQMASDVQAPLGSRESFRGIANIGIMAAPAIGEALGEAALLGRTKPPIQGEALPQIPETPIANTVESVNKSLEKLEQPTTGGIENAIKERQIAESGIAEHPGDGEGGTPAEAGSGGGAVAGAEVQGQGAVAPVSEAAVQFQDGKVFTGLTHGHAMDGARASYGGEVPEGYTVGYTDRNGQFLDKLEALNRAKSSKQIAPEEADKMLQDQKEAGISEKARGLEAIKFNALKQTPQETAAVPQPEQPIVPTPTAETPTTVGATKATRQVEPIVPEATSRQLSTKASQEGTVPEPVTIPRSTSPEDTQVSTEVKQVAPLTQEKYDVHAMSTSGGGQQIRVAIDKNGIIVGGVGEIGYAKPDSSSLFGENLIGQKLKDIQKEYPSFKKHNYTISSDEAATWRPEESSPVSEAGVEPSAPVSKEAVSPKEEVPAAAEQAMASRRMEPRPQEAPVTVRPLTALKGVYKASEKAGEAGYARGLSEARTEGKQAVAQIKGELQMADRWMAGDQEKVRQNMVEYVNANLPPAERGRFIGAITRAMKRPAIQAGEVRSDPSIMYRHAFNVMKAIENRAEEVYRVGVVNDIKGTLKKSLEAPGIDVAYRRQLQQVADGLSLTKPSEATLSRLRSMQEFVDRERTAGREPSIPKEHLNELATLGRLPLRDMPVNALEQLQSKVDTLVKLGRLKANLMERAWDANKQKMVDAMSEAPSSPIEERPLLKPQPTENLTTGQKFMNLVKGTMNNATKFEQAIAPMDEIYDHIGAGNGSYTSFPSRYIKGNLDLAENSKLSELVPIHDQSSAIIKKYGLSKSDMETIGIKGIVDMIGRERLEAMDVRPDIIDKIEKTKFTKGQQEYYDFTRGVYDSLGKRVQDVAHRLYQQDMDIVDNYVPLLRDWAANAEREVPEGVADPLSGEIPFNETSTMNQLKRDFNPKLISRTEQGFIKDRIEGAKTPVHLNAEDVFLRHVSDALHFVYQQPVVKMLSEVARTPEFKAKYGKVGQNIVLDNLDTVASQGYVNRAQRIGWIDWVRNSTSKAAVGFRLASNIVHTSQVGFEATHAGGPQWWSLGLQKALTPEGQRFLRSNAAETYFRSGGEPAQADVEAFSKVGKAGFFLARNIDKLGAQATFTGRYMKEMSKKGIPIDDILSSPIDRDAQALALTRMHRAVASPMAKDIPQMTSRGTMVGGNVSVARAINQFRNIFLDNWSNVRHDLLRGSVKDMDEVIGHLRQGDVAGGAKRVGDTAAYRAAIAAAVLSGVAMETGIKMGVKRGLSSGMSAITGVEPPPQKHETTYMQELGHHLLNRIPFVGQATTALLYGETGVPVVDAMIKPLHELGTAVTSAKPDTKAKHVIRATSAAATLGGIPGSSQAIELIEPKATKTLGKILPDTSKARKPKSSTVGTYGY